MSAAACRTCTTLIGAESNIICCCLQTVRNDAEQRPPGQQQTAQPQQPPAAKPEAQGKSKASKSGNKAKSKSSGSGGLDPGVHAKFQQVWTLCLTPHTQTSSRPCTAIRDGLWDGKEHISQLQWHDSLRLQTPLAGCSCGHCCVLSILTATSDLPQTTIPAQTAGLLCCCLPEQHVLSACK